MRAILFGGGLSLLISLLGTRYAIRFFTRQGFGQPIRDDGPTSHHVKRGTPTMGGAVIILATVIGYFAAKLITQTAPTASALLLLFLLVGIGAVGFLDDFLKVSRQHNLGLRSRAKMIGQTVVALVFDGSFDGSGPVMTEHDERTVVVATDAGTSSAVIAGEVDELREAGEPVIVATDDDALADLVSAAGAKVIAGAALLRTVRLG